MSSASRRATWLRSSPPRNAKGSSAVATKAAQGNASPAPAVPAVTSTNASSAHAYTGVRCSRSTLSARRQRRASATSTAMSRTT